MTTPNLRGTSSGVQATFTTTHSTALPVTATANDYVVVLFTVHEDEPVSSFDGLTIMSSSAIGGLGRSYLLYGRLSAGKTSIDIATTNPDTSVTLIFHFDADASLVGFDTSSGSGTTPDPPIPGIGLGSNYQFAACSWLDNFSLSSYPSGYSTNQITARISSGADPKVGAAIGVKSVSSTEDPGAFTLSGSTTWLALSWQVEYSPFGGGGGPTYTMALDAGVFAAVGEAIDFETTPPSLVAGPMTFVLEGGPSTGSFVMAAETGEFTMDSPGIAITPSPAQRWFGPVASDCVCDCCVKPIVDINIVGTTVSWTVSNADTATLTYKCNSDSETVSTITLTGGSASGSMSLGTGTCWYRIDAENECGPVYDIARNYVFPVCDCLHVNNETADKWGNIPPVVVTVAGTTSASAFGFCVGSSFCPTIGFSAAMYCGGPTIKVFRKTQATGCNNYHTFIQIGLYRNGLSGSSNGVGMTVIYDAFWYRKRGGAPTTSHYPTLTEIIPANPYYGYGLTAPGSVPWQGDTDFGVVRINRAWAGQIYSQAFIGSVPVIKCPASTQEVILTQAPASRCRDTNSGGTVDCPPLVCVPDLVVSMAWG